MKMKYALVTGGSRGIGKEIVKKLLEDGWSAAAVGTTPQGVLPLQEQEEALAAGKRSHPEMAGGAYEYICADISSSEDRKRIIETVTTRFGRLDLLVNNAGVAPSVRADLLDMSEESFDRVIGINTKGNLFLTQLAAKQMMKQTRGNEREAAGMIINIGSISADTASINRGEYCISKAGVGMLTKLFADRLAPEGILVYEVRPGIICTDMTAGVKEKYDALFSQGICPTARWGTPRDVAEAVSVLSEGRLAYSAGQVIYVDGGFHISRL